MVLVNTSLPPSDALLFLFTGHLAILHTQYCHGNVTAFQVFFRFVLQYPPDERDEKELCRPSDYASPEFLRYTHIRDWNKIKSLLLLGRRYESWQRFTN